MFIGKSNTYVLYDNALKRENLKEISSITYHDSESPTSVKEFKIDFSSEIIRNLKNQESLVEEEKHEYNIQQAESKEYCFENVNPYYDEIQKSYVIDFTNPTFIPSSKNFQVKWQNEKQLLVEQVKVGKNEFELKLRWPFSILNAFALSVSMFDPKIFL